MRVQIRKMVAPKAVASIGEASDEGCGRQQQDGEFVPGLADIIHENYFGD
jgi:hypothetical protein